MNILINNALVLPMDRDAGTLCFRGNVAVSGDRIVFVEETDGNGMSVREAGFRESCGDDMKIIDGRGKLVMPGLVNTHNHASMSLMRGYADDMPLMKWLNEYVWPFEAKLNGDDIRLGASLGIAEMLLGGTTTFVDMYWRQAEVAKAVDESGIRVVLSPTFTDDRFGEFEEDLKAVASAYAGGKHPRISLMIAPHSVYTCSREHLLRAKELADKYGAGINIHVSETMDEQETMRRRINKTPVEYLDELGLLDESTLVVHAVHVSPGDIEIMKERGVSVAHNPHSNMKISSGIAPVTEMLKAGINVSIGTDGPCSNNDLDMWEEFRTASFLQKVSTMDPLVLPAYEILKMATVNGAEAIGLGDKIGRLKEGMLADMIILDIEKPHLYPAYDMVANLVYCAKAADVETVIVNGRIVVENRGVINIDVPVLCGRVAGRVQEIIRR